MYKFMRKLILFFNLFFIVATSAWANGMIHVASKNITVVVGSYINRWQSDSIWYQVMKNAPWQPATMPSSTQSATAVSDVIYADGMFEAIGDGSQIFYSTDGKIWKAGTGLYGDTTFKSIIYTGNMFVAVGGAPTQIHNNPLWVSTDGKDWHEASLNNYDDIFLSSVTSDGKGTIIAVGEDEGGYAYYVYSKDNGKTFYSAAFGGKGNVNDIIYANGKFIAVADYSTVFYSTDGMGWTQGGVDGNASINKIIYVQDWKKYIAVGSNETAYYSNDGENWTQTTDINGEADLDTLDYSNGTVVAGGYLGNSNGASLVFSHDGINWEDGQNSSNDIMRDEVDSIISYDNHFYALDGNTAPASITLLTSQSDNSGHGGEKWTQEQS